MATTSYLQTITSAHVHLAAAQSGSRVEARLAMCAAQSARALTNSKAQRAEVARVIGEAEGLLDES